MAPAKRPLPLECATRQPSHSIPPLENSTRGFRSATDLATIFRPITSLVSKRAPFTAGHMHIPGPTRSRALHIWRRKRSEEHTSELQSQSNLVCRLLLEKKKKK